MINIAIVDDDSSYRKILCSYLKQYEEEYKEKIAVTQYTDGKELLDNYDHSFDIILLDIEMKQMDGVATAKALREFDSDVVIIFITNCAQFAINGYEVAALDYVLKPIAYYAFSQRIERAIERMKRRTKKYLSVVTGKGNVKKVAVAELLYVEVYGHSIIYHMQSEDITSTGSIAEIEEALGSKQFFRCNKGYLVNLEHVESIDGNMAQVGKDSLQVSRAKKKAFMDALNDYINEVSK